ncbi:hypothetical protein [Actinoplanes sp. NPDC049118]|uniref:hypothetical protein n=1 Tax=Actinoplanes sp. NPDC049118 TaxID=3155769 RepID=UPI0033F9E43A
MTRTSLSIFGSDGQYRVIDQAGHGHPDTATAVHWLRRTGYRPRQTWRSGPN